MTDSAIRWATHKPPNKEMERAKRSPGTGRRALRAGAADRRFAAHLQRSAHTQSGQPPEVAP